MQNRKCKAQSSQNDTTTLEAGATPKGQAALTKRTYTSKASPAQHARHRKNPDLNTQECRDPNNLYWQACHHWGSHETCKKEKAASSEEKTRTAFTWLYTYSHGKGAWYRPTMPALDLRTTEHRCFNPVATCL